MPLPRGTFVGGIAVRGGWHASAPMGRLEIGDNDLTIYGTAIARGVGLGEVRVTPYGPTAVRLSTGVLAVRVSIIGSDGTELEPYFPALARRRVREVLRNRGWPTIEDHGRFGRLRKA